jgi:epoxide hydrolase
MVATSQPDTSAPGAQITPFTANVEQSAIDDLKHRLATTRWIEREPVDDWRQGVPLRKAEELVAYWRDNYDWRRFEKRLNTFPQFRTNIDGLGIHFLHVRSPHEDALPMLVTHGWPGSINEFLDVIGPLVNPTQHGGSAKDAFHLVIPSLPGYGFSDRPSQSGWNHERTAAAWGTLMARLGYAKWIAQGGDWGSLITHTMARQGVKGLIAAHSNFPLVAPAQLPEHPNPGEQRAIDGLTSFAGGGSAYFAIHATRPQTIGYGLVDSPVALATWIYEKFQAWTDNDGDPEDALTMDQMLDVISLYWFTGTGGASARFYYEAMQAWPPGRSIFNFGRIDLPMAGSVFPREAYQPPREWAEASWPNLLHWNEVDQGGHFAAFEQPALFTAEVRDAFRSLR